MTHVADSAGPDSRGLGMALAAVLSAILLTPDVAVAQVHCQATVDTSDAALAARYAPVMRFAPNEPYFPTIPFFSAFDAFDNNENGLTDFEDVEEIAAFSESDTVHASWDVLNTWYVESLARLSPPKGTAPPVPPVPAMFYRVKSLSERERDDIWRYLKSDILALKRSRRSEWHDLDLEDKPFKVIQYYHYYVGDRGLVGHPEDIEFVFVYVPADPVLACRFRIVVGAGHTERVPNNVMVIGNQSIVGQADLARTDTLTDVIVELGGHSSAPDMPPYGQFQLGIDVNWQTTKSWGTRDIQAIAEMGYGGRYHDEMTAPRDSALHPVVLWPMDHSGAGRDGYALLPAPLFEELYDALPDAAVELTSDEWAVTIDTVAVLLDSIAALLGSDSLVGVGSLDSLAVRRMAAWNRAMISDPSEPEGGMLAPRRAQVWKHSIYTTDRSTLILKPHLFPPSMKSIDSAADLLRLISWGFTTWPGSGFQLEAGFVIPWFALPIRTRGFFEIQAGIGSAHDIDKTEFSLGLTYNSSYFQRASWYTTVTWLPDPDVTGSHFTVSAGPSFLLWSSAKKSLLGPVNILRISTGPRFRLSSGASSGVDWEFAFSFRQ